MSQTERNLIPERLLFYRVWDVNSTLKDSKKKQNLKTPYLETVIESSCDHGTWSL